MEYLDLKIENIDINIGLSKPIKICFFTDVHFDGYWEKDESFIYKCHPELLNKVKLFIEYHQPNVLLIGGDILDDEFSNPNPFFMWLRDLKVRRKYFVLGNHDIDNNGYKSNYEKLIKSARLYCPGSLLSNEIVYFSEYNLNVIGLNDYTVNKSIYLEDQDQNIPTIVMSHNPDLYFNLENIQECHKLFLFGHTHGHQSNFFGKKQLLKLLRYFNKFDFFNKIFKKSSQIKRWLSCIENDVFVSGLYQDKTKYIYVSPGLGTHRPGRFNCPPTITFFNLT